MKHASQLQRYAAQLAKQLARQQAPSLDNSLLDYIDGHPDQVLDSLQGLVEWLQAGKSDDDSLINGYLFLIGLQLEHIRYQTDRHYHWAQTLVVQFQQQVVELVHANQLPPAVLGQIVLAIQEAKLAVDPQLFAVMEESMETYMEPPSEPPDLDELLASLARDIQGDEFGVTHALTEFTFAMPIQGRLGLAAAMLTSSFPVLREAAPLLVLDGRKEMRQGLARLLLEQAGALQPAGLRRLIAVRSWLPEEERPLVDQAAKKARQQGIESAHWAPGEDAEIHSTMIDGSGAQGFMIVSKAGRKHRLSSVLLRLRSGVVDAWTSSELQSKRTLDHQLRLAGRETAMRIVPRRYLDRTVQHHLAVGCQAGQMPPLGLLEVAEVLGASDWRPNRLNMATTVDQLFQELPEAARNPEATARSLKTIDDWGDDSGIMASWFEDDQAVADLLSAHRGQRFDVLSQQVLKEVIEPRREKWAEQILWVALWLRESAGSDHALWINFLLTARAVLQGHSLKEIPLFTRIASRTVMTQGG